MDVPGLLPAPSATATTIARGRHAADAVVLLACIDDAGDAWRGLRQQSCRGVCALVQVLSEQRAPWANRDRVVQALARASLAELVTRVGN